MKLHKKRQMKQTLKDDNDSLFQCVDFCFCINYAIFYAANMLPYMVMNLYAMQRHSRFQFQLNSLCLYVLSTQLIS
jgi:hypothetical protein